MPVSDDGLLAEQRAFYRARAPEYDEWWQRRGRYDRGPELAEEWDRQVAQVAAALGTFEATGDVLEMAGGTGWRTRRLARTARHLTVLDASPEALDLNRDRVGRADVEYVVADLFTWPPQRTYDVVFFSFWLSHVPRARFPAFWALVRSCLAPGGRVFLIDNRKGSGPASETKDPLRRALRYGPAPAPPVRRKPVPGRQGHVRPRRAAVTSWRPRLAARLEATRWFIFGEARLAEGGSQAGPDASGNTR